jgi:parvulin-like peptidyl-prolyl isomerase
MRHWLKEPLLHFLVAGGLLFAAYAWLNRGGGAAPDAVRITAAEVHWLQAMWARQWQRPPNEQELRGLLADYMKEVLLAREARALGLDDNDTVVRRRLAQKLEFLVQDTARFAEPREDELRQLYDASQARYRTPARLSFTHLYFKTEAAARHGLAALATSSAAELGDRSVLERDYAHADEQMVASLFGGEFASTVFALAPGPWHGPIASGYGFHLVQISERQAAQPRPFDEVRAQVLDEWQRAQQARATAQFFARLLQKYAVVVEESMQPLLGPLTEVVR